MDEFEFKSFLVECEDSQTMAIQTIHLIRWRAPWFFEVSIFKVFQIVHDPLAHFVVEISYESRGHLCGCVVAEGNQSFLCEAIGQPNIIFSHHGRLNPLSSIHRPFHWLSPLNSPHLFLEYALNLCFQIHR